MPAIQYDVLGLGNAIVDVIAQTDDAFLIANALHKGSMRLIDEPEAERLYAAMGPATIVSGGSAIFGFPWLPMAGWSQHMHPMMTHSTCIP